jgi:hypothetical protein
MRHQYSERRESAKVSFAETNESPHRSLQYTEAEERSQPKSKAEREAEAEAAREAALATALPETNKGFKMMAKFGFKQGDTLGKSADARKEPINVTVKEDRGGIGLESDKKRKLAETFEEARREAKRQKEEEGDFLEERRQQQKERKALQDLDNAQRTAERLFDKDAEEKGTATAEKTPLAKINVSWRIRVWRRIEEKRDKQQKRELDNSLASRLPGYADQDEENDNDTKIALGHDVTPFYTSLGDEPEVQDSELTKFESLPVADRLQEVLVFLRETYKYCLYCGYQYPDEGLPGCPGVTEEDHD